jgi:hypothetical protein
MVVLSIPFIASQHQRSSEFDAGNELEEAHAIGRQNFHDGGEARTNDGEDAEPPRGQPRQRLAREQIVIGAFSALFLLLVAVIASMFVIRVLKNATPHVSKSTALRLTAGGDCVEFKDYRPNEVVESDFVIGKRNFTFMAYITAFEVRYSMIFARDRCGEVDGQFRVSMWSDGRLGVTAMAAFADNQGLQFPSAVDPNGWGSHCTTARPLPLYKEVHFCLVRRELDWAIFLDGEHALPGGWTRQNPPSVMDLRFYADKKLRVGSRLPPTIFPLLSSSNVQDPFPGTIRDASLIVGFAITEEQIRTNRTGHIDCGTERP